MVDRVYKAGLPALRKQLEGLREEFVTSGSTTDWARKRIDPLIAHARSLERLLGSGANSLSEARLSRGVEMLHADLVYLRTNVLGLKKILEAERKTAGR
jgi:hypothetical protein